MKHISPSELVSLAAKKAEATTVPAASNIKSFDLGEFDEAALIKEEKSKRRWGWSVLIIGFGGFMTWSALAPLDQGAAMPGTVTVVGRSKVVQHPYGGIVDKILVKEGELVKADQVLVQLDATKLQSESETVRTQWITVKSKEARLMAELSSAPKITFPDWFNENANDPQVVAATKLQSELFRSRRDSRQAEIAALTENIQALGNSLAQLKIGMDGKREQLKYIQEQLAGLRGLEKEGFLARNRLLEAERQEAQIRSSLADDMGNLSRVEGQLAETRLRIAQRKSDLITEVQAEMADVQRMVEELSNRMKSVNFDKDAAIIKSPIDGYISNLQVPTVGGVAAPGSQLMHVVPKDAPFKIDAQLQVHLVDKVQPGMPVDVMFPALNQRTTPHIPGVVNTVSADRIVDTATGTPYYLVQIDITEEGIKMLSKYQIVPGMPAEAFVKQGERTMLNYLFKPLTDRLHRAMTEE